MEMIESSTDGHRMRTDNRIDPAAIVRLLHSVGWKGFDPSNIPGQLDRAKLILSAWKASDLVGYLHASSTDSGCLIKACVVAPGYHGNGLGSTLIKKAICLLTAQGCSRLEVEAWDGDPSLVEYYGKFGFRLTNQRTGVGRIMEWAG